jgi:hypothetical protein
MNNAMNAVEEFIIDHWEKKSNAILGFVVIQSIVLADALSKEEFITKIKTVNNLIGYLFFIHTFIFVCAVVFLILIDKKVSKKLGNNPELKKDIELHVTLMVKVALAIMFGLIPVFILYKNCF